MIATTDPAGPEVRIRLATAIAAAALVGFGLILWIAANWDDLGRMTKFAIVGATLLAGALAAVAHPALRIPGALVAFTATGGLFALFGQIYQTGADPWQLFALWAALGLPLALAARHDALFLPWASVALTAVTLWSNTTHGIMAKPVLQSTLLSWVLAAAILALLVAINWSARPEKPAHWAVRFSVLAVTSLIASDGIWSILHFAKPTSVYLLALAVLIVAAWRLAVATPFQLSMLALLALGIDALLIAGCVVMFFFRSPSDIGGILLFGIMTAIIMSLTATALLKLNRRRAAEVAAVADAPAKGHAPWAVVVLSWFGALITALSILLFLFLFLDGLPQEGPAVYGLAALFTFGAIFALRRVQSVSFFQQLAFIALASGCALLSFALFRDLPQQFALPAAILLAVSIGLAMVVPVAWVRSLLGVAGAFVGVILIRAILYEETFDSILGEDIHSSAFVALAAVLLLWFGRDSKEEDDTLLRAYGAGFAPAALIILANTSGPTFLLNSGRLLLETSASGNLSAVALLTPVASVVATLLGAGLILRWQPALKAPLSLAIATAVAALSLLSTLLGFAVLILSMALVTGRRVIAVFGAITALWIVGSLYHRLDWPLDRKGFVLVGIGLALGLALLLTRGAKKDGASITQTTGLRRILASGLIAFSTIATASVFGLGVKKNESLIKSGETVYIELAPVDPRSLMQGDYMALNFRMPDMGNDQTQRLGDQASTATGVIVVDGRKIARVVRIEANTPALATGERIVKLRKIRGSWSVGSNAWFFREGTGKKFEAAAFGEFRLGPAGDLLLVGMADKELKRIE